MNVDNESKRVSFKICECDYEELDKEAQSQDITINQLLHDILHRSRVVIKNNQSEDCCCCRNHIIGH